MKYSEVWLGRAKGPTLVLINNGAVLDLSGTTRVAVDFNATPDLIIDSSTSPSAFNWSDTVEYPAGSGTQVRALQLLFGGETIPLGLHPNCRLILYDPLYASGWLFTDELNIEVKQE